MPEWVNELGKIAFTEDVIATIAGAAATECYGIVGMAASRIKDGLTELLGRENLQRGVRVNVNGDEVEIALHIVVGYGTKISEVAHNAVGKVRYAVESATGLRVTNVRIHVQGVRVGPPR